MSAMPASAGMTEKDFSENDSNTTDLLEWARTTRGGAARVESGPIQLVVELRMSYRYAHENPWVVQAMTGFLSAYFMEHPGFRVQRHFEELESGMQVWVCEIPSTMKVPFLLRRLQEDLPPYRYKQTDAGSSARPQYVIDSPDKESPVS